MSEFAEFKDKVVLVTGAGRGIGRDVAEAFAACGAILAVNDITPVNLDQTVASILAFGGRVKDYVFDVSKKFFAQALVDEVMTDWGRIDVLVNHASVEPHASLLDMDEWDWHRTIDVNLGGPFVMMQSAGRVMREQGNGVIVNVAASIGNGESLKDRSAYAASQAGLVGLTRVAAVELAAHGIRVNAVCPGMIDSDRGVQDILSTPEDYQIEYPDELVDVAGVVLFLCSSAAARLTGRAIHWSQAGSVV